MLYESVLCLVKNYSLIETLGFSSLIKLLALHLHKNNSISALIHSTIHCNGIDVFSLLFVTGVKDQTVLTIINKVLKQRGGKGPQQEIFTILPVSFFRVIRTCKIMYV